MDGSAPAKETFAAYFAKYLIARQGYQPLAPPEAAELVDQCDFVLTKSDGVTFAIVAIVDREADPQKIVALSSYAVDGIAKACLRYAGTVNRAQMPASVSVYEIGPGAISPESIARLTPYRPESRFSKAISAAWALDPASGQAWTNMSGLAGYFRRRSLEKLLRAPRLSQAELVPAPVREIAAPGRPLVTYALLALLAVLFACEQVFGLDATGGSMTPSIRSLVALGGVSRTLVVDLGEWWRIFTAPLLHGGFLHLAFNGLALFLVGRLLERLVGPAWFAGLFAVSAIGGSLMSLMVNPANIVGIGASGGIVGLFAASLVVAIRVPSGILRTRLVAGAIQSLIPALIPFLNAATSGAQIDYGAHFGGAVAGVLAAFAMLPLWPADRPRPRLEGLAALVAAAFFAVAAGSLLPIVHNYRQQSLLAPDIPADRAAQMARADDLVRDYPHDPRARLVRAIKALRSNDVAGAQEDLRAGLSETELLQKALAPDTEHWIRALLAATLAEEGKADEGRDIARPVCASEKSGAIHDLVASRSLCP